MNKIALIQHLNHQIYCRVSASSTSGVGIVAIRDIPAKTNPFIGCFDGDYHPFSEDELTELPRGIQKMVRDYCVCIDDLWCVPESGFNSLDVSLFINHSSTPHVGTTDGETFVTLKTIKAGEELLVDYNTYTEGFLEV